MATVVLAATITCPECGFAKAETMPTNACQFFYSPSGSVGLADEVEGYTGGALGTRTAE